MAKNDQFNSFEIFVATVIGLVVCGFLAVFQWIIDFFIAIFGESGAPIVIAGVFVLILLLMVFGCLWGLFYEKFFTNPTYLHYSTGHKLLLGTLSMIARSAAFGLVVFLLSSCFNWAGRKVEDVRIEREPWRKVALETPDTSNVARSPFPGYLNR